MAALESTTQSAVQALQSHVEEAAAEARDLRSDKAALLDRVRRLQQVRTGEGCSCAAFLSCAKRGAPLSSYPSALAACP